MIKIEPEHQRKIAEDLSHSEDSGASTDRFNRDHGATFGGRIGHQTMELKDLALGLKRTLPETHWKKEEVEASIQKITGQAIDLDDLHE